MRQDCRIIRKIYYSKCRKATIVFDGYNSNEPSTKDCTHRGRGMLITSPVVNFFPHTVFVGTKSKFLASPVNKTKIIALLGNQLISNGCEVVNTTGDAEMDVVKEGVKSCSKMNTTIIGEDSDLLVLILNHYSPNFRHQLYFRSNILRQKTQSVMYNVKDILSAIGPELRKRLLFLHAFTGCDTTSHIFGVGKPAAFQLLLK